MSQERGNPTWDEDLLPWVAFPFVIAGLIVGCVPFAVFVYLRYRNRLPSAQPYLPIGPGN